MGVIGVGLFDSKEACLQLCQAANLGGFLEVYVQSLSFLAFLECGELASAEVPQVWQTGVQDFDDESYLLGLISSLKELERYAVNRGKFLDLRSVCFCLATAQSLEQALMQFNFRNSELRQRFDSVKYVVKKLESLVYEIDMARKRSVEPESSEDLRDAEANGNKALDLPKIAAVKSRYDKFDELREEVMKRSRDVVKSAKNAIYALQREDWARAEQQLQTSSTEANAIYTKLASTSPTLRLGFFSSALEELAEALAYRDFCKETRLQSLSQMQEESRLTFPLLLTEYLGGIMDLTGEVGRLAIRTASQGNKGKAKIESCLTCVEAVYDGIQIMPYLSSNLRKKVPTVRSTMLKIEQVLYELALLSKGFASARPTPETETFEGHDRQDH